LVKLQKTIVQFDVIMNECNLQWRTFDRHVDMYVVDTGPTRRQPTCLSDDRSGCSRRCLVRKIADKARHKTRPIYAIAVHVN